jgi:hypothetical protein
MFEVSSNREISIRIIRDGQSETVDNGWADTTPEDRIEAVWILTRLCLAWNDQLTDEPGLQRTITRLQRSAR